MWDCGHYSQHAARCFLAGLKLAEQSILSLYLFADLYEFDSGHEIEEII